MIWEKERGELLGISKPAKPVLKRSSLPEPVKSFIPFEILKATLQDWQENSFLQNLLHRVPFPMDSKDIETVISLYLLGTICKGYRAGAITFPFIDKNGNIRAIQAKQFDKENHTISTDFLHSILKRHYETTKQPLPGWLATYLQNDGFVTCYFGEHLLNKYPANPVALVEAPKTAIIGTLYFGFPDNPTNFLWLATYNLTSLSAEKCKVLKGRDVYLFPDLNAFDRWQKNANEIALTLKDIKFKVSDLLEKKASEPERKSSLDLADYLTRFDWRLFRPMEVFKTPEEPDKTLKSGPVINTEIQLKRDRPFKQDWTGDIAELESYFAAARFPDGPVMLNNSTSITDCSQFIRSHLATLKANNGNKTFLPFLNRLIELKVKTESSLVI